MFESGLPIVMVGWDVSHKHARFGPKDEQALRRVSDLAAFCVDIQKGLREFGKSYLKQEGFDLPDPIAMAVALDPEVATITKRLRLGIETKTELTRGATVVDHLRVTGLAPNADVVLEASRERFLDILYDAVR